MNVMTETRERQEDSYKILDDTLPDVDILQNVQSRRRTDVVFLYVFAACIVLLMPFLIYTLYHSDINRLKGYDDCGNICGQKNVKYDGFNCSGRDHSLKPIYTYHECMDIDDPRARYWSPPKIKFFDRFVWKIVLVSFVPLAICLILIILLRYVPAVAVWSILVLFWLICTAIGLLFLYIYHYIWYANWFIIITCIMSALLLFSLILFKLKYIRLASLLLKEATRALFEIKFMCFVPIGAFSVLILTFAVYVTICFHIGTAGKLGKLTQRSGYFLYIPDKVMETTLILNSIIAFWTYLVIIGTQNMSVGRAIGQWYTTKNQDSISAAVPSSLHVTVKYHLGTVVLGSLLTTVMFIPRAVLQFLKTFSETNEKADAGLRYLDGFFTSNSYIITAMKGTSFIQSGKQATKLLKLSIGNTRDLNLYVNLIITLGQSVIIFVSTLGAYFTLSYVMHYSEIFTLIELGIGCCCAYTILGTLRVSANTLFFCATEKLLRNKDADLPFTMTMEEILDGSNKLLLQKVQNVPPYNIPEKSFYIKIFMFIFVAISCVLFLVAYFI